MALTELAVKNAKGKATTYRLRDERNLYLQVSPSGGKYWIVRYWEEGKEKKTSLGPYPAISLKEARARRDELHTARAKGERISEVREQKTTEMRERFGVVAGEWLDARMSDKAPSYVSKVRLRLDRYILPALGNRQLSEITSGEILRLCRKIEASGHVETARRVRGVIGQVFRFAIASDLAESDPTAALAGALATRTPEHYATITERPEVEALIASFRAYPYPIMRSALLFSALVFCRPGEVRHAEWKEFDGAAQLWKIPPEKMKMNRPHLVPLSRQALKIVEELREWTGQSRWLFPSPRNDGRCMSENGVRVALRSLGFEITPHGFRSMASTILNEEGFPPDHIERQLAHSERNAVRAAYNHAEYLDERRKMMQWWGDFLLPEEA